MAVCNSSALLRRRVDAGDGLVGSEQSLCPEPEFEQVGPLIQRRIALSKADSVRTVREDVHLRRNAGFDQRLVKTNSLLDGDSLVVGRVKEECRRRVFGDKQIRRIRGAKRLAAIHHVEQLAIAQVRSVRADGADPRISENQVIRTAGNAFDGIIGVGFAGYWLRGGESGEVAAGGEADEHNTIRRDEVVAPTGPAPFELRGARREAERAGGIRSS